jgi:hypothetical protein
MEERNKLQRQCGSFNTFISKNRKLAHAEFSLHHHSRDSSKAAEAPSPPAHWEATETLKHSLRVGMSYVFVSGQKNYVCDLK